MKKLLSKILIITFVLAIFVPSISFATTKNNKSVDLTNVEIDVKDVNVSISTYSEKNMKLDYDSKKFDVSTSKAENTISIKMAKQKGTTSGVFDRVTLYVPNVSYGTWTVNGDRSGISLPEVNADFKINNINGALSLVISKDFKGSVDYTVKNGSSSIDFDKDYRDFQVNANILSSSVLFSSKWSKYRPGMKNYSYKNGTGEGKFNFNIQNSSFVLSQK